jgi:hypothetical protein
MALFRLVIGEDELPGLWECVERQFIPAAGEPERHSSPPPWDDAEGRE